MKGVSLFKEVPGYARALLLRAIGSIVLWIDFTLIFSNLSYYWHANATTVGLASALYGLPGLILGPYFGRIADSYHPITVLRAGYGCRAASSLFLAFAPNVEAFLFLVFVKGVCNLGSMPAEQVMMRSILTPSQLIDNARWVTLIDQALKVAAPLVGAAMVLLPNPEAAFILPSVLSLAALIILCRLQCNIVSDPAGAANAHQRNVYAIVELSKRNIRFRLALGAALIQTAVLGLYDPLLAVFLRDHGLPAGTFGTIVSCTAAGGITAAVVFKRIFASTDTISIIAVGLIGFGLTVVLPGALSSSHWPIREPALLAFWLANGFFYGMTAMSFGVVMQTASPVHQLGTISATARSAQLAALVAGPPIGSTFAKIWSIPTVFIISGIVAVLTGAAFFIFYRLSQPEPVDRKGNGAVN